MNLSNAKLFAILIDLQSELEDLAPENATRYACAIACVIERLAGQVEQTEQMVQALTELDRVSQILVQVVEEHHPSMELIGRVFSTVRHIYDPMPEAV